MSGKATGNAAGRHRVVYDRGVALILEAGTSPARAAAHALAVPVTLVLVAILAAALLA